MKLKDTFTTIFGYNRFHRIKLSDIIYKLWTHRSLIFKSLCLGIVIGLVICFSIPKEYTTKMQLCLEKNNKTNMLSGSILSELIDMAITPDAYSENLYALLISTPQFNQDLLNIQVPLSKDNKNKISLRQYLDKEQSKAWWNYIIDFPANCIELLIREDSDNKPGTSYMPTLRDAELIEELQQHISLSQIESTGMMELEVEIGRAHV